MLDNLNKVQRNIIRDLLDAESQSRTVVDGVDMIYARDIYTIQFKLGFISRNEWKNSMWATYGYDPDEKYNDMEISMEEAQEDIQEYLTSYHTLTLEYFEQLFEHTGVRGIQVESDPDNDNLVFTSPQIHIELSNNEVSEYYTVFIQFNFDPDCTKPEEDNYRVIELFNEDKQQVLNILQDIIQVELVASEWRRKNDFETRTH